MFVRRSQSLSSASSLKVCIAYVERKDFPLSLTFNRWFSRYVIAAMLVDGKQKLAYQLVLFVHQHLFISPLLFVSPEIAWKLPIGVIFLYPLSHYTLILSIHERMTKCLHSISFLKGTQSADAHAH